ncbi:hypothetical protein Tco_0478918 [Tanacetum coccineum]
MPLLKRRQQYYYHSFTLVEQEPAEQEESEPFEQEESKPLEQEESEPTEQEEPNHETTRIRAADFPYETYLTSQVPPSPSSQRALATYHIGGPSSADPYHTASSDRYFWQDPNGQSFEDNRIRDLTEATNTTRYRLDLQVDMMNGMMGTIHAIISLFYVDHGFGWLDRGLLYKPLLGFRFAASWVWICLGSAIL